MVKIMVTLTYDEASDKYFTNGFATDTDGKATQWEVNEEIIMRAHDLGKRRWDKLKDAIDEIKQHTSFTVKVRNTRPKEAASSSYY